MNDIKIFVSHRIDIESELIDNSIYVPVRCGAIFDKREMNILGDDTGDNISEKRMSFSEFTVQYWAWKNVQADYYGLCHYRRYLSFAQHRFKTDEYNMIPCTSLMPHSKVKFGLLDAKAMQQIIQDYDIIVSEYADVRRIPTPHGKKETVHDMWAAYIDNFFEKSSFDLLYDLIDKMAPEYSKSARQYFAGNMHRGFNCYVLKKELFYRLCELQFPIMFEVERKINSTGYSPMMMRTPAFIGEMLYGIFIYHITTYEQWSVKELQMVFFRNTNRLGGTLNVIKRYVSISVDKWLRFVFDPILPIGSKRREKVKNYILAKKRSIR